MMVLDTHVLIWLTQDNPKLGRATRRKIDKAHDQGELSVSAITFWECEMLQVRGRIRMRLAVDKWRKELLAQGLSELPVDGEIAYQAARLSRVHGDPADCLILATAEQHGAWLVTADETLLSWTTKIRRQDATT